MDVVILCGGLGTRLREETEFRPKPMVTIGPRPILWHIMKIFATQGYTNFILALGYKGDMIKQYFLNYETMNNDLTIELGKPQYTTVLPPAHEECGWRITLADTGAKTLKGARLKKVAKYIHGDTFLLTYGDGLADVDINKLIAFHESHNKACTITGVYPSARFGELKLAGDQVVHFNEKQQVSGVSLINGGFMVMNRCILDQLTEDDSCDLEIGLLEQLAEGGELMVYRHQGFWACMDNLRDTEYLNRLWAEGRAAWKTW